jgi:hypothetical protein
MKTKIWFCKIGEVDPRELSDIPMRYAVHETYVALTGQEPKFIFSGWNGELTESERAVVDDRMPLTDHLRITEMEKKIKKLEEERDMWKRRAFQHGCDLEKGDPDCE